MQRAASQRWLRSQKERQTAEGLQDTCGSSGFRPPSRAEKERQPGPFLSLQEMKLSSLVQRTSLPSLSLFLSATSHSRKGRGAAATAHGGGAPAPVGSRGRRLVSGRWSDARSWRATSGATPVPGERPAPAGPACARGQGPEAAAAGLEGARAPAACRADEAATEEALPRHRAPWAGRRPGRSPVRVPGRPAVAALPATHRPVRGPEAAADLPGISGGSWPDPCAFRVCRKRGALSVFHFLADCYKR